MIGDILQPTHLLFILVIALLVLGPKKLPEVGRQLGSGLRDFRAAINGDHTERSAEVEHQVEPPAPTGQETAAAPLAGQPLAESPSAPSSADPPAGPDGSHEFASEPATPAEAKPDSPS